MFFSYGHYLPPYLNIDDLQLSFSKEFRCADDICIFLFSFFHFPCCTLAVECLVDNIVEELGLVGVDVVACVGNHLQLDPDPENRCQGDCHAGGQGGALSTV